MHLRLHLRQGRRLRRQGLRLRAAATRRGPSDRRAHPPLLLFPLQLLPYLSLGASSPSLPLASPLLTPSSLPSFSLPRASLAESLLRALGPDALAVVGATEAINASHGLANGASPQPPSPRPKSARAEALIKQAQVRAGGGPSL